MPVRDFSVHSKIVADSSRSFTERSHGRQLLIDTADSGPAARPPQPLLLMGVVSVVVIVVSGGVGGGDGWRRLVGGGGGWWRRAVGACLVGAG